MFTLERFRPDHLTRITAAEPALYAALRGLERPGVAWASAGPGYTALRAGEPFAAAGLAVLHHRRAVAWAWIGECGPALFQRVHREVMRGLMNYPIQRIEAAVRWDHERGHRWCRLLGFEVEVERARGYLPDGGDASIYVRIRP